MEIGELIRRVGLSSAVGAGPLSQVLAAGRNGDRGTQKARPCRRRAARKRLILTFLTRRRRLGERSTADDRNERDAAKAIYHFSACGNDVWLVRGLAR
jgi:hypothetical protein